MAIIVYEVDDKEGQLLQTMAKTLTTIEADGGICGRWIAAYHHYDDS